MAKDEGIRAKERHIQTELNDYVGQIFSIKQGPWMSGALCNRKQTQGEFFMEFLIEYMDAYMCCVLVVWVNVRLCTSNFVRTSLSFRPLTEDVFE